jgi:Rrf2 family protein
MRFSKKTDLAIHGMWLLTLRHPELILISDMAKKLSVSESYLAKVFQKLAGKGLVRSVRGKRGGFTLAHSPAETSLADVVNAVDVDDGLYRCLGKQRGCESRGECVVHETFTKAKEAMLHALAPLTLAELNRVQEGKTPASWLEH